MWVVFASMLVGDLPPLESCNTPYSWRLPAGMFFLLGTSFLIGLVAGIKLERGE